MIQILRSLIQERFLTLWALPASIVLLVGSLPLLFVQLDTYLATGDWSPFVLQFTASSAQSILSTIAGSSMTALSLAYSLALLVFTLAAGNIGPRLIERFTSELSTQFTAGILGGSFLYSLHTLLYVQDDFVPKITIAGAGALAVLSVLQLIYFVRMVARNITIDQEVAQITQKLENALGEHNRELANTDDEIPDPAHFKTAIRIDQAGYLTEIDTQNLCKIAKREGLRVFISFPEGEFLLPGQEIARVDIRDVENSVRKKLLDCFVMNQSRSEQSTIEFSIRLLLEIALRALSPGVNDTYTAIAAANGLSRALWKMANFKLRNTLHTDNNGDVRVIKYVPGASQLFGTAFHPLRRASGSNILMAQALAENFAQFHAMGDPSLQAIVEDHCKLLMKELRLHNHQKVDVETVASLLPKLA